MWDRFQRELLAALGHTVYVPVAAEADTGTTRPVTSTPAPVPSRQRPMAASASRAAPSVLQQALAHAAGLAHADLVARLPDLPALAHLRGDARAKRALWPRLRALRRPPS